VDLDIAARSIEIVGLIVGASTLGGAISVAALRWRPRIVVSSTVVAALAAVAAAGTGLLRADHPVGSPLSDKVYVAMAAAVVTVMCVRVRTSIFLVASSLVAATTIAGGGAQSNVGFVLSALVLGALIVLRARAAPWLRSMTSMDPKAVLGSRVKAWRRLPRRGPRSPTGLSTRSSTTRSRVTTIIQAGLAPVFALSLLTLPTSLPSRVPTLVATLAVTVIGVSSWMSLVRPRRIVVAVLTGTALVAVGASIAVAALALNRSRGHGESAVSLAESALGSAEGLNTVSARTDIDEARRQIALALADVRSPLARPAQFLPVVGVNVRATISLLEQAEQMTTHAAALADTLDPAALRPRAGAVNLAALRASGPDVVALRASLDGLHDLRSRLLTNPWVVPPLKSKITRFDDRLDTMNRSVVALDDAIALVPRLLGDGASRRYLLVLPTPAEARGSGGVIGNYGEIVVSNGSMKLAHFGRNGDLQENGTPLSARVLEAPKDYVDRYLRFGVAHSWSNINMSPDFPSSALAMANAYPQSGGSYVDGVISADPIALAAMLKLVGPLDVAEWDVPLTSVNAAQILMHDSYVRFADDKAQRLDFLSATSRHVWEKLLAADLPEPATLGAVLGPVARGRHLQVWMRDAAEQNYMGRLLVDGAVPAVNGDSLGVVINNASGNKIDYYLHREVDYDVTFDSVTRQATATATIALRNDAPSSGEPDYVIGNVIADASMPNGVPVGTSRLYVSVYSVMDVEFWTLDGTAVEFKRESELGRNVASAWIDVASRSTVTMTVAMKGRLRPVMATADSRSDSLLDSQARYRLDVFAQPLVHPEERRVTVTTVDGDRGAGARAGRDREPEQFSSTAAEGSAVYRAGHADGP
jgi:Protein of unknown function (DUF4012)